ncbi:MAG: AAA family ATPase [Planctomycetota bacterium]
MSGFAPIENPRDSRACQLSSVSDPKSNVMPVMVNLGDVEPMPVRWLWPGRIARGKLTLLIGDPGQGKSMLTVDLASRVSTGSPWPDTADQEREPAGVVMLNAEDDAADTVRPRLDAHSGDACRVNVMRAVTRRPTFDAIGENQLIDEPFDLTRDLDALGVAISETPNCQLVTVDPISAYCGQTDTHRDAAVRGTLAPLSDLAARHGVAVVAVAHMNKSGSGPAVYRAMGSLAFAAAARAVWVVAADKDDKRRRLFLPVKNNLAPDVLGLAFGIEDDGGGARIGWEPEPINVSADFALGDQGGDRDTSAVDEAAEWLTAALEGGPVPAIDLFDRAKADGVSKSALQRAKPRIGAESKRDGFGGPWSWSLPHRCSDSP